MINVITVEYNEKLVKNVSELNSRKSRRWLKKEILAVTGEVGEELRRMIVQNASGPPGPNVVTGAYRASWQVSEPAVMDHKRSGFLGLFGESQYQFGVSVSTDAPQANRLEYGFYGADSMGRVYRQAPLPHVRPAVHDIQPIFGDAVNVAVERILARVVQDAG